MIRDRNPRKPFVFEADGIWFVDWYGTLGQFDNWKAAYDHAQGLAR